MISNDALLALINRIRTHTRLNAVPLLRLKRGIRGRGCECPVAKAFKDLDPRVQVGSIFVTDREDLAKVWAEVFGGPYRLLPGACYAVTPGPGVRDWILAYDAGRIHIATA